MSPSELEHYLHAHIPLSRAMQVHVEKVEEASVVLSAPLAPNLNHRETLFGGSASAIAILAAWSLLHTRLRRAGMASRLVIQRNSMEYELPVAGAFTARASLQNPAQWDAFVRMLARKGKARIAVVCVLDYKGREAGHLLGEFVALGGDGAAGAVL